MKKASYWYKKMQAYDNPELNISWQTWSENVINEARKEAIEEASQIAYTIGEPEVGEEILNLINELK